MLKDEIEFEPILPAFSLAGDICSFCHFLMAVHNSKQKSMKHFFAVFILFTHCTSWIFNRKCFFSPLLIFTRRVLLLCLIQLPTHTWASSFFLLSALLLLIPVISFFFPTWVFTNWFYIFSLHFLTRMTLCPAKASHVNEIVTFCISNWTSLNNWQLLLTLPSSQSCSLSIMLTITVSFG